MGPGEAADIVLAVNMTFSTRKTPSHIRLQWLAYDEKGNLSGLQGVVVTSGIKLAAIKETILMTARRVDSTIIDVIGDQKGTL